jgi:FMN phosphatase YigB (HAD superfamily)
MLSGEVKLLKPDPRIFKLFLETFAIDPALTGQLPIRVIGQLADLACSIWIVSALVEQRWK